MPSTERDAEEGVELPIRMDSLRRIFDKYDRNKDGKIEIHELKHLINSRQYEQDIPPQAVKRILARSDTDNDGYLDFEEFVKMVHDPMLQSIFGHLVNNYVKRVIPKRNRISGTQGSTDVTDGDYEEQYSLWPPPIWMLFISVVEIILFSVDSYFGPTEYVEGPIATVAIFNPIKRYQAWRFITYMFVHVGYVHLVVNILVQILLGIPLEMVHRGWRVLIIYFCGVLAGSLGTTIADPRVKLAGASGGVYAIITAHVATLILNWKEMQFALAQMLIFFIIIAVDFGTALYNRYNELNEHIGYAAHVAGAISGLLVGIFTLRNLEVHSFEKKLWWISLITYVGLITAAIIFNIACPWYFPKAHGL